ncbi:transposase [Rhodobacter viridis]|uniref:Transposase n=1 Tax=Rhodobacter viridis TaxID=1054202 RepID=A0A318TQ28_9RHOB|nr:transposase [Rhodobacter viridis]PYF06936.1 transposase [Rhodobacter viridis]
MLDEKEGGDVVVWGIPVITADNGRRIWPDEIKAMAVKKIEAGTKIVTVAKEIGANESLVAKWARAELPELPRRGRPQGKTVSQGKSPQFVEVMAPSEPVRATRQTGAADAAACQIRIGDAEISLRGDFPAEQLAEILRAVRASQ